MRRVMCRSKTHPATVTNPDLEDFRPGRILADGENRIRDASMLSPGGRRLHVRLA